MTNQSTHSDDMTKNEGNLDARSVSEVMQELIFDKAPEKDGDTYRVKASQIEETLTHHTERVRREARSEGYFDGIIAANKWLIENGHVDAGNELNQIMLETINPK